MCARSEHLCALTNVGDSENAQGRAICPGLHFAPSISCPHRHSLRIPESQKLTTAVQPLLADVLDAHGGLERWRSFDKISSSIVTGGFLWAMKGITMDGAPRTITSQLHREWTSVEPFGAPAWRMVFVPKRVAIETRTGDIVAEREHPRAAFAGHAWETRWDPLHLAYFNGYAMWTYDGDKKPGDMTGHDATDVIVSLDPTKVVNVGTPQDAAASLAWGIVLP